MKGLNFDEKLDSVPDEVISDFKEEKFDECFAACEKILTQNPTNKIALIYSGIISQKRDQDDLALKYFNLVTEVMPLFPHIWEYKGHSLLKIKEYDLAKDTFMRSMDLNKNNAAGWCFLALSVYLKGGKESKEAAYYVLDHVHDMVKNVETNLLHSTYYTMTRVHYCTVANECSTFYTMRTLMVINS